jgi:hypothetical protein
MGKVPIPTDELSGIPLLLAPQERALSILWDCEPSHDEHGRPLADWDHTWYPGREIRDAGWGGHALRNSRVQFVLRADHEEKNAYFDPPERLPQKPSERFRAAVLCAAGYIPLRAIGFNADGYFLQDLDEWQRVRARESGEVRVASPDTVQKFMTEFVLSQPIDHIRPWTIKKFLRIDPAESSDASRKQRELAYLLLSLVIDRVEDPLVRPYTEAHQRGLLSPHAPPRPDYFIRETIAPKRSRKNFRAVVNTFVEKLTAHIEGPEAVAHHLGRAAVATA